jgi:hypothetical protein
VVGIAWCWVVVRVVLVGFGVWKISDLGSCLFVLGGVLASFGSGFAFFAGQVGGGL